MSSNSCFLSSKWPGFGANFMLFEFRLLLFEFRLLLFESV